MADKESKREDMSKGDKSEDATETIKPTKKGQKPITFHKGGLHESTGTPKGEKIPAKKRRAALEGKYGPKAKKQAQFAKNVLKGAQDGTAVFDSRSAIANGLKEAGY